MILSRIKPAIKKPSSEDGGNAEGAAPASSTSSAGLQTKAMPKLEEFLDRRDYTGAMTLLEFNRSSGKGGDLVDMWLGYCAFHVGDYKRSMLEYEALTHAKKTPKDAYLNLACIFFYLGESRCNGNCDFVRRGQINYASFQACTARPRKWRIKRTRTE